MATKATTTIRQVMHYQPEHAAWFAAHQALFNQVAAFYFEVIQAREEVSGAPTRPAAFLEQIGHFLLRPVERTHFLIHPAQSVDWHLLVLGEGPYLRA